jgi:hypothetical protein
MNTTAPLRAWLDAAWARHDSEPLRVLAELAERAPGWPDDAEGAEALSLAEHVALGHLADPAALERLLPSVPPHAALERGVRRARWALDTLAARPTAEVPDALRWQATGHVALALALGGRLEAARQVLFEPEAAALASNDAEARRAYAASANNVSGGLRDVAGHDAARDALMVDAALLARRAWERAGTWIHVERADYFLAKSLVAAGRGSAALAPARACLARCEAEGADAYERFFAHECLVLALRAAGEPEQAQRARERMVDLLARVTDAPSRAYCEETLAKT